MALFAVHVQHFMIRSLKFEAQYLQICRYNYAVATLLLETHLLLFVAGHMLSVQLQSYTDCCTDSFAHQC